MIRLTTDPPETPPRLGMMAFLATDGGRRCPLCGKFAKPDELGDVGGWSEDGTVHVSMYGHLPGFGCNAQRKRAKGKR